jgi:hypothetical protein
MTRPLETLRTILDRLVALRGLDDQTIRMQAISILFSGSDRISESNRFLECMIEQVRQEFTMALAAEEDDDERRFPWVGLWTPGSGDGD